jgi:hypothetical protein
VSWPDAEERRCLHGFFSSCPTAVGVLDGTHCQIRIPTYQERDYYSGYKHYHTQNYIICADALGFVTYIKGPFEGRGNDRAAFNETPFVHRDCELLSEGELILVDGGFKGPGHTLHQFTASEFMADMSEEEKKRFRAFNEDFTHTTDLPLSIASTKSRIELSHSHTAFLVPETVRQHCSQQQQRSTTGAGG